MRLADKAYRITLVYPELPSDRNLVRCRIAATTMRSAICKVLDQSNLGLHGVRGLHLTRLSLTIEALPE